MGIRVATDENGHPGEWKRFAVGDDSFELLIRPCPEDELERLRGKFRTRVASNTARVGGARRGAGEGDRDRALSKADRRIGDFNRARARYSLLDSKGLEIEMATEATAAAYATLLGGTLTKGQAVKLDGKLSDEVKERLIKDWPGDNLTRQINATADAIGVVEANEDAEIEDDLSGN